MTRGASRAIFVILAIVVMSRETTFRHTSMAGGTTSAVYAEHHAKVSVRLMMSSPRPSTFSLLSTHTASSASTSHGSTTHRTGVTHAPANGARSGKAKVWPATLTPQEVYGLVNIYHDWNPVTMVKLAFCESSYQPLAWNSTPVWVTKYTVLHSTGLLGVLGGSFNPVVNVQQAHDLYVSKMNNGQERLYQPWASDFISGCA